MDAALRRLERAADPADPSVRARLLAERARAGHLAPARLRLAAWLGDEAARLALGEEAAGPSRRRTKRDPWTRELAGWGPEALVRAALVVIGEELRHWRRHHKDDLRVPRLLAALEAWTLAPGPATAARVGEAVEGELPRPRDDRAARALARVVDVAHIILGHAPDQALGHALRALGESPPLPQRAAIREALVPWALGEGPSGPG